MNYHSTKLSPKSLEKKHMQFELEVKTLGQDGKFSGYASVFDVVDNHNDIIRKGAFKKTLGRGSKHIKLLWQHKQDEPIGIFLNMFEDDMGLYVEGQLLLNVARAKEAYTLLKQGVVSGLSIGYSPIDFEVDQKSGARELTEIELWEISLVTFPANTSAGVTVVKSMDTKESYSPTDLIALQDAVDRASSILWEC